MQFEPVVLFSLLGYPVYAFGLSLALSALVCAVLLKHREKKQTLDPQTTSVFIFYALIFSIVLARLLFCLLRWQQIAYDGDDLFRGYSVILRIWEGGFTLYGAFAGVVLAALVTALRTKQPVLQLLDWAAPICALMIALGRGAEILGGGGFGAEVLQSAFAFFPVAVFNEWLGSWNYAVFMAEAVIAMLILCLLLRFERKPHRAGDITLLFLLYYGAAQIVLERFRHDDFLTWGFVLVAQVICAAFILFVAGVAVYRSLRTGSSKKIALFDGLFALIVIICSGLVEYLFDKNLFGLVIDNASLHIFRAVLLLLVSVLLSVRLRRVSANSQPLLESNLAL